MRHALPQTWLIAKTAMHLAFKNGAITSRLRSQLKSAAGGCGARSVPTWEGCTSAFGHCLLFLLFLHLVGWLNEGNHCRKLLETDCTVGTLKQITKNLWDSLSTKE